ncbi:CPBP family intramembrane glutamic endopeptidase [Salinifilum ghardaiensis]
MSASPEEPAASGDVRPDRPAQPGGAGRSGGAGRPGGSAPPAGSERAEREHRWGLGAFFLAQAVFVLVSVVLAAMLASPDELELVLMLVLPTLVAGGVAVLITVVRGNGPRVDFGLRWRRSDIVTGLSIGGAGLVTTTIATGLWTRFGPSEGTSAVTGVLDELQLPPALAVVIFLYIWLVAPLCEELIYRGLLWGAMERLRWSRPNVLVLTTAIFAIGHLEPERTWLLVVIAVPVGIARMVTGRLTASVVAHQVNNFLPALGLLLVSLGLLPA